MEEYYFLRNNLPSKPEEVRPPLGNTTRGGLDSVVSLGGYKDSKKMRESMRQFAKDNDVIHVTIDRQSLAQLTNLSERDIRRDENVKLVTNKDEMPMMQLGGQDGESNVKTMYGTFNKEFNQLNQQSPSPQKQDQPD